MEKVEREEIRQKPDTRRLEVWGPTDRFLEFSKRFPHRQVVEWNRYGKVERLIIPNYPLGSYKGCIGLFAVQNNKEGEI